MAAGGKQAKIASKKGASSKRFLDGKEVKPVYFYGSLAGQGNYMAVDLMDGSSMVSDKAGKPHNWKNANIKPNE